MLKIPDFLPYNLPNRHVANRRFADFQILRRAYGANSQSYYVFAIKFLLAFQAFCDTGPYVFDGMVV